MSVNVNIQKFKTFFKENENKIVISVGGILIALISFGLGFLWRGEFEKKPLKFEQAELPAFFLNSESAENYQNQNTQINLSAQPNQKDLGSNQNNNRNQFIYVASKRGKYYHLSDCPGAKMIKPENLIKFNVKEEAERAGYKPASNCKF